jgi:hypothetical protein
MIAIRLESRGVLVCDLAYALSRRGDCADRPVTVAAEMAGGPIRLNEEQVQYGSIGTGRTGSFQVVAAETGQYQIRLTAQGGYNQPTAVVLVVVKSARPQATSSSWPQRAGWAWRVWLY